MPEIIVVGGSTAGAATAIHLARAGHNVVLLERRPAYQRKACGEGLFPRGVRELAGLGLLDAVQSHAASLEGVRFHAGGTSVAAPFGAEDVAGLGVQRAELDPRLLECARAAGVDVRLGVTVHSLVVDGDIAAGVRTNDEEIPAAVVVAADGIGSRLRRQAGLGRTVRGDRYGVSAHVRLPDKVGRSVDVYFERGYELYVTPVGDSLVNVALLLPKSALGDVGGNVERFYTAMLSRHLVLFAGAELIDAPLVAGPFAVACRRPWRRNLVLVGDAAGFLDAINGEGMSAALVSARYCAAAVDRYLQTGDEAAFRRYAVERRSLLRNTELLAHMSLALAARPALARRAVQNLARRPQVFARLLGISIGELPLRTLRPSDLVGLALGV